MRLNFPGKKQNKSTPVAKITEEQNQKEKRVGGPPCAANFSHRSPAQPTVANRGPSAVVRQTAAIGATRATCTPGRNGRPGSEPWDRAGGGRQRAAACAAAFACGQRTESVTGRAGVGHRPCNAQTDPQASAPASESVVLPDKGFHASPNTVAGSVPCHRVRARCLPDLLRSFREGPAFDR